MSAATPGNAEKPATGKSTTRATKQRRSASPSDSGTMPPPPPRPSREQIFRMNQDLDGGPTPRDLSIHRSVVDEGESQREVAVKYGISQARVSQIVKGVDEWSLQVAEDRYRDFTPGQRRRLAEHTFRQRLDYFYSQALGAWRASQQGETIDRTGGLDSGSLRRSTFGKTCYLEAAMRIAERIAELDWVDVGCKRRAPQRKEAPPEAELAPNAALSVSPAPSVPAGAAPEAEVMKTAPESPQREKDLSPAAPAAAELSAEAASQASKSSEVTKKNDSVSLSGKGRSERREPLITPHQPRDEDAEREALYRDLQTLLAGLG